MLLNVTKTRAAFFADESQDFNLYDKQQNKIKARKALEQIIISLQQNTVAL